MNIIRDEANSVEINPDELWANIETGIQECLDYAVQRDIQVKQMGISCHRSTCTLWDRQTGRELHNCVTWQDGRGAQLAQSIMTSWPFRLMQTVSMGLYKLTGAKKYLAGAVVQFRAGMTAINLAWLIRRLKCHKECQLGRVKFGTLDTWLLRKLSGTEMSEISMAATTGLFDPFELQWSAPICRLLGIPMQCLPRVIDTDATDFGSYKGMSIKMSSDASCAIIGDNMVNVGEAKVTLGTGAFASLITGDEAFPSATGVYPIIAWRRNGTVTYAAEISELECGGVVDYGVSSGFYRSVQTSIDDTESPTEQSIVYHHNHAFLNINKDATQAHYGRAILDSVAYQTHHLLNQLKAETGMKIGKISINGGVAKNDHICQTIANLQKAVLTSAVKIIRSSQASLTVAKMSFMRSYFQFGTNIYLVTQIDDNTAHSWLLQPVRDALGWLVNVIVIVVCVFNLLAKHILVTHFLPICLCHSL